MVDVTINILEQPERKGNSMIWMSSCPTMNPPKGLFRGKCFSVIPPFRFHANSSPITIGIGRYWFYSMQRPNHTQYSTIGFMLVLYTGY